MRTLVTAWRCELDKLMRRKKYPVFLLIGLAGCFIWAILGQVITNFAARTGGVTINLTPTPMGALPFFLQVLLPLLIFMGVTDLFTTEGSDGTMKAMLMRPVERWKLYVSKIAAVMTYVAGYLICVFIFCFLLSLIFNRSVNISQSLTALASYALTVIPLTVLTLFAALVALQSRSGTLAMFLLIIIYITLNTLPAFIPVLSQMLFTSYLGWHRLWIGALPGISRIINMLLIVLSSGVVFYTAGSLLFDKAEY